MDTLPQTTNTKKPQNTPKLVSGYTANRAARIALGWGCIGAGQASEPSQGALKDFSFVLALNAA
ncbi:MAG: hypothetical protein HY936_06825 [Nitrosomonadales bacterium]|nr:hypothetical protein [Nitrosomonadales bacterium]